MEFHLRLPTFGRLWYLSLLLVAKIGRLDVPTVARVELQIRSGLADIRLAGRVVIGEAA